MLFHQKIEICEVKRNLIKNNESGLIRILKRLIFNNRSLVFNGSTMVSKTISHSSNL